RGPNRLAGRLGHDRRTLDAHLTRTELPASRSGADVPLGLAPLFVVALLQGGRGGLDSPPAAVQQQMPGIGARHPAFARDGRLAVSVHGDIWTVTPSGEWTHLTSVGSSDREPSWSGD